MICGKSSDDGLCHSCDKEMGLDEHPRPENWQEELQLLAELARDERETQQDIIAASYHI
jgi:hypothetical protein